MRILKSIALISWFLIILLQGCFVAGGEHDRNTTPSRTINSSETIQGKVTAGSIVIKQKNNTPYARLKLSTATTTSKFTIEHLIGHHYALEIYRPQRASDILHIRGNEGHFSLDKDTESVFPNYYGNKFIEIHKSFSISSDFEGVISVFLNGQALHHENGRHSKITSRRSLAYGQELATALKNNKPKSITHMGKNNTYPVGAQEPVVIDHTAEPDSVRALMKAAITTGDPRLLVIERTDPAGKVRITAFGKTETIDAGETYEWKFGEAQLNELRKFVVKR